MRDFSFWEEYEGTSEGSGRSEKIWLKNPDTGQTGLFKFKKDIGTTDHVSECIAFQIAQVLDIPCARFELGTYKGREGSVSYNIIEQENQTLIEGIYFISLLYPTYDVEKFIDVKTQHRYSIEMILASIEKFVPVNGFLNMLLFDYLIGNTDRHQSNWAVVMDRERMQWSPLYDNSSSLCAYIADNQVDSYLGNDRIRWRALTDTKSKSLICCRVTDDKRPTHLEVIKYLKQYYGDSTKEMAEKMSELLTRNTVENMLSAYTKREFSDKKKILIGKYLDSKIQMLQDVYRRKAE